MDPTMNPKTPPTKVYVVRLITYTGTPKALQEQLQRSLVEGTHNLAVQIHCKTVWNDIEAVPQSLGWWESPDEPSLGTAEVLDWPRFSLSELRQLIGWLSGDIPELHTVEIPQLADSLNRFLATLNR